MSKLGEVVDKGEGEGGGGMRRHTKKREEKGEIALRMTGQHSGRRGCFYTQEGYIADVL